MEFTREMLKDQLHLEAKVNTAQISPALLPSTHRETLGHWVIYPVDILPKFYAV
jgi:hypothetical protein